MSNRSPFEKGFDAYWNGKIKSENPYEAYSAEFSDWEYGWEWAKSDMHPVSNEFWY